VNCSAGWACEHRWRTTANLVGFHNAVTGTAVTNWWSNGGNQIGYGRGAAGYVSFNRASSPLTRTFASSLPAGTYCDVANGDVTAGSFTDTWNGPGATCTTVAVTFAATVTTTLGQNVYVLGNRAELSN
jgi:alpha-amylase